MRGRSSCDEPLLLVPWGQPSRTWPGLPALGASAWTSCLGLSQPGRLGLGVSAWAGLPSRLRVSWFKRGVEQWTLCFSCCGPLGPSLFIFKGNFVSVI